MYSAKAIFFAFCTMALLAGCAGQAKRDQEAENTLAQYHTTCLKRRLAIDTPEHSRCVAALYSERQNQMTALRGVVTPEATSSSSAASQSAETSSYDNPLLRNY